MFLSYQYRLCPSTTQEERFLHIGRELTYLWNHALGERRDAWLRHRRSTSYFEQQGRLKDWRAFDSLGLGEVPFAMARDTLQRLDLAYRAAFRRCKKGASPPGFPHFRRGAHSFTFIPGKGLWGEGPRLSHRLYVPGVGHVSVRKHRDPPLGRVKSVTIHREAGSKWLATLQYEVSEPAPPPTSDPVKPIGVDVGLNHLATLSTGEVIDPPRHFETLERRLASLQRRLARKKRGSRRYANE